MMMKLGIWVTAVVNIRVVTTSLKNALPPGKCRFSST